MGMAAEPRTRVFFALWPDETTARNLDDLARQAGGHYEIMRRWPLAV
jgi:hypothetical protein